eukprot:6177732-Alexandrium_andersonii.AAC.1
MAASSHPRFLLEVLHHSLLTVVGRSRDQMVATPAIVGEHPILVLAGLPLCCVPRGMLLGRSDFDESASVHVAAINVTGDSHIGVD